MDYTIEVLRKKDLVSYKKLIDECFGCSNDLSSYELYSQKDEYVIWVVKDKGDIIASITQYPIHLFTFSFQPSLMLFNVAVKEDYRTQGIARNLLDFVIHTAKKDGYASISLTCLKEAQAAHRLYESVGFRKMGSLKYELIL